MERILIIGPGGAGKSTLATRIGERLGLPIIHLDREYWHAGWVPTPNVEWARRVEALVERPRWVMDGNYGGTLARRLVASDTAIFLDLPRRTYLWRVVKRWLRFRGRSRPDMPEGCPEQLSAEFLLWLWRYPHRSRNTVVAELSRCAPELRVVHLRSPREIDKFLATLGVPD